MEAQQAEASDKPANLRQPMTAEEAAASRERENLRLSRQNILQRLESSTNPRQRKLLQDALAALDEQMREK